MAGRTTPDVAAQELDAVTRPSGCSGYDMENGVNVTWSTSIACSYETPEHHSKLVAMLICLLELPNAHDENGRHIWQGSPTLGWDLTEEYNAFHIPTRETPRTQTDPRWDTNNIIRSFINLNTFVALLNKTGKPNFNFSIFALWTMRAALESPVHETRAEQPVHAWIPAAAEWVRVMGAQMYQWDREYKSGSIHGAPGRGGPLWDGKHGFCKERWALWRRRFDELAASEESELDEETRAIARQAATQMAQVESRSA